MPLLTTYPPDPANVFPSDFHRRTLAYLPRPDEEGIDAESLLHRIAADVGTTFDGVAPLEDLLNDLCAGGDAVKDGTHYRQTESGYERLTGPALEPTQVPETDEEGNQIVDSFGDPVMKTVLQEPPPKEGKDLERAEEVNEQRAKEDREIETQNRDRRKKELQRQLEELEEEGNE